VTLTPCTLFQFCLLLSFLACLNLLTLLLLLFPSFISSFLQYAYHCSNATVAVCNLGVTLEWPRIMNKRNNYIKLRTQIKILETRNRKAILLGTHTHTHTHTNKQINKQIKITKCRNLIERLLRYGAILYNIWILFNKLL